MAITKVQYKAACEYLYDERLHREFYYKDIKDENRVVSLCLMTMTIRLKDKRILTIKNFESHDSFLLSFVFQDCLKHLYEHRLF